MPISTTRKLPSDGNNKPLPMANSFTLTDDTGTPQVSPIASAATEANAAGELRTVAGGVTGGKAPIPAGAWFSIPGKAGDTTLIGRAAGATTIHFCFELLSA